MDHECLSMNFHLCIIRENIIEWEWIGWFLSIPHQKQKIVSDVIERTSSAQKRMHVGPKLITVQCHPHQVLLVWILNTNSTGQSKIHNVSAAHRRELGRLNVKRGCRMRSLFQVSDTKTYCIGRDFFFDRCLAPKKSVGVGYRSNNSV